MAMVLRGENELPRIVGLRRANINLVAIVAKVWTWAYCSLCHFVRGRKCWWNCTNARDDFAGSCVRYQTAVMCFFVGDR